MERQIKVRVIKDRRVLEAMGKAKRHIFVPADYLRLSYEDYPLLIGAGQRISHCLPIGRCHRNRGGLRVLANLYLAIRKGFLC